MRIPIICVALLAKLAFAQCEELISTYDSSEATGVHVENGVAYVADGVGGLLILDVSDAENPTFLGSAPTPGQALRIAVVNEVAYIADNTGGLQIFDVVDVTNPAFLGALPTADQVFDVAVQGSYAYLAADQLGMQVIDVSDPTLPMLVGEIAPANEGIRGIDIEGTVVYTVGALFNRFEAFSVVNPTNPVSLFDLTLPDVGRKVSVVGGLAYIANNAAGVQIYNVTIDPPQVIGAVPTSGAFDVDVDGDTLYVADNLSGVLFIDVSVPTSPAVFAEVDPAGFVRGVDGVDGFGYGAGDLVGLHVMGCTCAADVNGDGNLNILDFVAFQSLFTAGDPGADCDANGLFNILDFVCFQSLFTAGCD